MIKLGDVQAEYIKVLKDKRTLATQTQLAKQRLGNFAAPLAAPLARHLIVNLPNSQLEGLEIKLIIKSLLDRIAAIEKKLESLQLLDISRNSLAILTRIKERLAFIEKKVAQVNNLTKNMSRLLIVIKCLLEKSRLSKSSI